MKKLLINSMFIVGALLLSSSFDASAQGRSNDAPGRGGNSPGNSGNAPGRGGSSPGNSGNAPGHNKPGGGNKPGGVPIDGGASILLAAGAAYGLKKVRDYRNSSKCENQDV